MHSLNVEEAVPSHSFLSSRTAIKSSLPVWNWKNSTTAAFVIWTESVKSAAVWIVTVRHSVFVADAVVFYDVVVSTSFQFVISSFGESSKLSCFLIDVHIKFPVRNLILKIIFLFFLSFFLFLILHPPQFSG